jgi:uncharacterized protein YbbC (DUF1343 family)
MSRRLLVKLSLGVVSASVLALGLGCASKPTKAAELAPAPAPVVLKTAAPSFALPAAPVERLPPVMLGIDVLEAEKFSAIAGKKIGLLTHPAGINRRGESTIDVIRRAPNAKLVALFAPEHGLWGLDKAGDNFVDTVDKRTGLPVYSLHGKTRKPTKEMLKGLDALVIDLQDIGTRSYTFISCLRWTMEACFENGVEVIVLDRPNPLGGLKVDGPPLDAEFVSYVGAFRVPYVHGLTIGELARIAKNGPGVMAVTERVREKGRLTVIPMRGWRRAMQWPDTELKWVATSPFVQDYAAVMGYAMTGLGTELGGFTWGIGINHAFRGIGFPKKTPDEIIKELEAYNIPGIRLFKAQGLARDGKIITGVYVDVINYATWRPTELSFYMMKTAAKWNTLNPFTVAPSDRATMFNKLVGSGAWWNAIRHDGRNVDVASFINNWAKRDLVYQQQSKRYWLYQ